MGVTLSALVPLLATVGAAPARAAAGTFVTLVVVPALQVLAAAFFGRWAALGVGSVVALLTLTLVVGPAPALTLPAAQRRVALDRPVVATLAAPARAASSHVLADGGKALVFVCLASGEASDLDVALNGAPLRAATTAPAACWRHYDVPLSAWNGSGGPVDVTVSPRAPGGVALTAGYSPTRGERPFIELRVFARDGRLAEIWS